MLNDRRKFMISTGMAAGAAFVGQLVAEQKFTPGESAESDVSRIISKYGNVSGITRDSAGVVQVTVKIRNHGRLAKLFTEQKHLPFDQVRATPGNTLEFVHRGERFALSHRALS